MKPRRTTVPVSFAGQVATLAWKDLRIELRSRELLYTMTFFAAIVVLIFSFAFVKEGTPISDVVPGILWATVSFAGTLGLSRAFGRERENDTMRGLLLTPASRTAVFLGKAVSIVTFMVIVEIVVAPMIAVLFNAPMFQQPLPLILSLVLATIGFSVVGSVFAAMLLRSSSRDALLPVVLYPILVPMLIAATKSTAALLETVPDMPAAWFWIKFLAVYDAIFIVVSLWTFESLVID